MEERYKSIIHFIILGILIYFPVSIKSIPTILSLFLFGFFILIGNKKKGTIINISFYFSLIIIYSLNNILISQNYDVHYFRLFFTNFIIFLVIYSLTNLFKIKIKDNINILLILMTINTVVTYIQYFDIWHLKQFFLDFNYAFNIEYYAQNRAMGLLSGFDLNGIFISIALFLILISYYYEINITKKIIKFFLALLTIVSIIFTARIGIVVFFIGLVIMFVMDSNRKKLLKIFTKNMFFILPIFIFFINIYKKYFFDIFQKTNRFIFEGFINYREISKFKIDSFDALINSYVLPNNLKTLFLGNSLCRNNNYIIGDSGYIQVIWGLGIVGLLLIILFYFILTLNILKIKHKLKVTNEKTEENNIYVLLCNFCISFFFIILIATIKGPYFFSDVISPIYYYVFNIIISKSYSHTIQKNNFRKILSSN